MLAYSVTPSGLFPRMLWALLLLAASLNAYNKNWDHLDCTQHEVTVDTGDRVVMACNISNPFRDVTIELTAYGKTSIIFNQMPPGSYINNSWWLQIQGGQARLVITDTQGIHAGEYWWTLRGSQTNFKNFTLNVTGLATDNQELESLPVHAESLTAVRTEVISIIIITTIIIITGISVYAWYKHHHSLKLRRYKLQSESGYPGSPTWHCPKVSQFLPPKIFKRPY